MKRRKGRTARVQPEPKQGQPRVRVFISWSGARARKMAEALKQWLEDVLQYVDVFYSEEDIAKGTRSDEELSQRLEGADFGITCLTPENIGAPWVLYETGALAHRFKRRACPYLLDLAPAQVPPPLGRLQCARADKTDTLRLLRSIDETADERALGSERLERGFEQWWPRLEGKLRNIPPPSTPVKEPARPIEDMVTEILSTVREVAARDRERTSREERSLGAALKYGLTAIDQADAMRERPSLTSGPRAFFEAASAPSRGWGTFAAATPSTGVSIAELLAKVEAPPKGAPKKKG